MAAEARERKKGRERERKREIDRFYRSVGLRAPLFQEAPNFRELLFRSIVSRAHAHTHPGGGGRDTYRNQMLVLVIVLSPTCVHSVILKMSAKRKHKTLSLSDKCTILQRLDKGESSANLAREFNVGKSTISDF
jgi:hypothetical protein